MTSRHCTKSSTERSFLLFSLKQHWPEFTTPTFSTSTRGFCDIIPCRLSVYSTDGSVSGSMLAAQFLNTGILSPPFLLSKLLLGNLFQSHAFPTYVLMWLKCIAPILAPLGIRHRYLTATATEILRCYRKPNGPRTEFVKTPLSPSLPIHLLLSHLPVSFIGIIPPVDQA